MFYKELTRVGDMKPAFKTIAPVFGVNYDVGYIGFTYQDDFISRGIAYFTRWGRLSDIRVTHTLVVTGENECVEAIMGTGVVKSKLNRYFENSACKIFFRKPKRWNKQIGNEIAETALKEIGDGYDNWLIGIQAFCGTIIGRFFTWLTKNTLERLPSRSFDNSNKWICSELVAHSLGSQTRYNGKGILSNPFNTITPQELFEDKKIFTAWKKGDSK